jgi:hypothetical protein
MPCLACSAFAVLAAVAGMRPRAASSRVNRARSSASPNACRIEIGENTKMPARPAS